MLRLSFNLQIVNGVSGYRRGMSVLVRRNAIANQFGNTAENRKSATTSNQLKSELVMGLEENLSFSDNLSGTHSTNEKLYTPAYLESFGGFREKLIEVFATI